MTNNIYIEKINAAIDYIRNNLDRKLSLEEISKAAGLSKFHFHRIFHAFTGDSLYETIIRLRVEKLSGSLLTKPAATIAEVAAASGFDDPAEFSTAFKKRFSVSPSLWRKKKGKIGHDQKIDIEPFSFIGSDPDDDIPEAISTEIKKLEGFSIAYIRHTEAYAGDSSLFIYLYNKLTAWAAAEDLLNPECENIVVYHDPLEVSDDSRLKISLGISVPESTKTDGDIGKMQLQGGEYLICRYKLRDDQYSGAWESVYRTLLPKLGLQPSDGYCFELYPNKVENSDKYSTIVDICIPVEKL